MVAFLHPFCTRMGMRVMGDLLIAMRKACVQGREVFARLGLAKRLSSLLRDTVFFSTTLTKSGVWRELVQRCLNLAKTQVCNFKDAEVVEALFRVKLATPGSADEAPAWTLGDMYFCQPELVAGLFKALPIAQQKALYSDFLFGFENVVYDKPRNNQRVLEIRRRLEALEPK